MRNSQGGMSENNAEQFDPQIQQYQKNAKMRIQKNKTNLGQFQITNISKLSQQRTINLNFFEELNVGLEHGEQIANYDTNSVSALNTGKLDQQHSQFQDLNFSIIHKNPKVSEFLDQADYEYSREIETPPILHSYKESQYHKKSNMLDSTHYKNNIIDHYEVHPKLKSHSMMREQPDTLEVFNQEPNSALDMAGIMHKSNQSKNSNYDYNSQNQDSEGDQFVQKISLLSQIRLKNEQKAQLNSKRSSSQQGSQKNNLLTIKKEEKDLKKNENSILHVDEEQDNSDIYKKFQVDVNVKPQQDERRARQMIINKLQDFKNKRTVNDSFFMIVEKLPIEKVDDIKGKCSKLRRCLCITRININHLAHAIIKSKIFEAFSLLVIIANSVFLAIEDPTSETQASYQAYIDTIFLVLYSVEMALKILGLGFVFNKGAYLRDAWNVLDFTIVMTGYLQLLLQGVSFNLSGLRAFRVLRPLKSISSIEGLKVIVSALLSSLPLLRDTFIVLVFFFFIFAIAGLQLFSGYLKKRCVHIETGVPHPDDKFCGYIDCDPGYFCGKRNTNPNYDQTNFDTIFYSLIAIFSSVTLEGWTSQMYSISQSFTSLSPIFFIPLVFIGAFFLMNLTLAVIKSKFTKQHEERKKEKQLGLTKKKKKNEDYVTHDHLNEDQKKEKEKQELELRNLVLKKWRMIIFIKERMRNSIKIFKEKKINETLLKNKTITASTGLENAQNSNLQIMDYGMLFSSIDQNNEVEQQNDQSARIDQLSQQSQRQLLFSQQKQSFQQTVTAPETLSISQTKVNKQNFRQLDQEAILEEDDEYKTEFSNIIHNVKNFQSLSINSKNTRNTSPINFFPKQQLQHQPQNKDILIQSPEKKMKLQGMISFKKQKKKFSRDVDLDPIKLSSPSSKQRKFKFDEQFFQDFINKDLEVLERHFSEQQLIEIVQQVDDPQNYKNCSHNILDLIQEEDFQNENELEEMSILTDDFNTRKYQINPYTRSQYDEINNDDRNQTPFTSTTVQQNRNGNAFQKRSSNIRQNYLASQELTISDINEKEDDQNNNIDKNQEDLNNNDNDDDENLTQNRDSPKTYQNLSNDFMNSNEVPLNRLLVELTSQEQNQPIQINNVAIKMPRKSETQKLYVSNALSSSNGTTANPNGTINSEQNSKRGHYRNNKTLMNPHENKKRMGSTKIIPFEINSFDPKTADQLIKARNGPNTIFNQDVIPVEQSVLNSRFLISSYLSKNQKLYLRKEQFDFAKSSEDILEQRNKKYKELLREKNRINATTYIKNWKIKPYQRKMKFSPKLFKPDEDQIEFMQHLGLESGDLMNLIQLQYDEPYITNLYVTGTLSIAIHDKNDHKINKTRKIQNSELSHNYHDDELEEQNFNQSISAVNQNQTSNSNNFSSPVKRIKTALTRVKKSNMRILTPQEQLQNDIRKSVFIKATSNPIMSRSFRSQLHSSAMLEIRKQGNTTENTIVDSAARRAILLKKQAAKDPKLQRKLILSGLNKDAYRSNLFRMILISRKNRITQEELDKNPHIEGMLDIYEGEDEDESDEEEEESDSDDDIKDDFLDRAIDCKVEVLKAKKKALFSKQNIVQWSGQDVLTDFDPSHANRAIYQLSKLRIWPKMAYGYWKKFQVPLKLLVKGTFFDNFMTAAVFVNTVALALDRYGIDDTDEYNLTLMNTIFTWIFICEMSFKIVGLGPIKYFKDRMNYLDCFVVLLSIVEMSFNSNTNLSAFRAIRIFRTFRVLRVARLLRSMQSMQIIISVLVRSMDQFIYLALLLLLFIFIYALLGMQIFGNNYNFDSNFNGPSGVPKTNYDSFTAAFLTTFQILTLESWPQLFYDALRSPVSKPISALYFISWVFLGNFMLLNLFLAILLDSFTEEAPHKKSEEEENEKELKRKHLLELEKKEGQQLIEYYQEVKEEADNKKRVGLGGKKKKNKKKKDENMLDESFEFDKESLTKKVVVKKVKIDFEGVECDRSFYFFSKKNIVRIYLYRTVTHTAFETIIIILIILSSIKLVVDTYIYDLPDDDPIQIADKNIDFFFTAVFAMESFLKALVFGFIQDKGSYLRESWSQLDFFIVVTSVIDASFESINVPIIKILRLLRTLRPLRLLSHNSGMKTIVVALIGSIGGIVNVLIVVMVVWMMFAILAVNFFGGKMQYCTVDTYNMATKKECLKNRGEWKTFDYNFDNVPQAMITLFALATLEDWPDIMYNAINIQGVELGPSWYATPQNGYFFVVYILIGSYLFLNLFVGVIFKEFEDAQEEEKANLMLKEHQIKWVDMMKMIVKAKPDLETTNKPKAKWRAAVHTFITGEGKSINYVDIFVMACIVLNMFQMAINFEGSSTQYNTVLDYINYFFTGVFVLECILKLIAFGTSYFKNSWNVFDFCVVFASLIDISLSLLNAKSLRFLRVGPQLARVMRVLRVSRLFRLVNKYKGLQALIQTITFSLPQLFNVFSLLMLVYFIFAVLATFLFRNITEGVIIDEFTNFTNFSYSMMTVIRMSTGEDWIYIMYDCMRTPADNCIEGKTCGISYAPVFFIPYIMISEFIMLNLFILVIIQQFELYYLQEDNVLEKFKDNLELFKKTWTKFTRDQNCLKLKDTKLITFFRSMDAPLGMSDKQDKDIIKNVVLMELVSDEEGFVYFNELLFRAMRRVYGESHVKNKILVEHELRTMRKIEEIKQKLKKKQWMQERANAVQVNPFMLQMYMNISFKAWLKKYKENLDKREVEREYLKQSNAHDNFDLLTDESNIDKKNDQDDQGDWEYQTLQDMEVTQSNMEQSDEENEEVEQDDDDVNGQDSSRQLRNRPPQVINIVQLKNSDNNDQSPSNQAQIETKLFENIKKRISDVVPSPISSSNSHQSKNQQRSKESIKNKDYQSLNRLTSKANLNQETRKKRANSSKDLESKNRGAQLTKEQKSNKAIFEQLSHLNFIFENDDVNYSPIKPSREDSIPSSRRRKQQSKRQIRIASAHYHKKDSLRNFNNQDASIKELVASNHDNEQDKNQLDESQMENKEILNRKDQEDIFQINQYQFKEE